MLRRLGERSSNLSGVELIREGFLKEVSFEPSSELGVGIWVIKRHEDDIPVVWTWYRQLWTRVTN